MPDPWAEGSTRGHSWCCEPADYSGTPGEPQGAVMDLRMGWQDRAGFAQSCLYSSYQMTGRSQPWEDLRGEHSTWTRISGFGEAKSRSREKASVVGLVREWGFLG